MQPLRITNEENKLPFRYLQGVRQSDTFDFKIMETLKQGVKFTNPILFAS